MTILPRLLANRPIETPLRIWVAGCASGEEAYSVIICLLEQRGTAPEAVPIKVFPNRHAIPRELV
jgi:two-component system, chemotaxis family, CheB/CheR fusion protein